jgi:hypothetical protein
LCDVFRHNWHCSQQPAHIVDGHPSGQRLLQEVRHRRAVIEEGAHVPLRLAERERARERVLRGVGLAARVMGYRLERKVGDQLPLALLTWGECPK